MPFVVFGVYALPVGTYGVGAMMKAVDVPSVPWCLRRCFVGKVRAGTGSGWVVDYGHVLLIPLVEGVCVFPPI